MTTRPVLFVFERARAQRHSLLGKGHPYEEILISSGAFQGHQGNNQGAWRKCLREVSGQACQTIEQFAITLLTFQIALLNLVDKL